MLFAFWKKRTPGALLGAAVVLGALAALLLAGCAGGSGARRKPPDQRYGHRYEQPGAKGRRTLTLTAPPAGHGSYATYDVPVSEVIVRTVPFEEDADAVPAELLIEGALPNDCLALHDAQQKRDGHFLYVTFTMRWPQKTDCERYERPFRFYLPLEGRYAPGDYTLKINGSAYPFSIHRGG